MAARRNDFIRPDFRLILSLVSPASRVLDLGCGEGELLALLAREKAVMGQGVEIDPANISRCVGRGVPAIQADVDEGLKDYPDQSFDWVILNQTLQVVKRPDRVLREMARVGKVGIVGFPNFGHFAIRLGLLFTGRKPRTPEFPEPWYSTPDRHLLTTRDFEDFCRHNNLTILRRFYLSRRGLLRVPVFPAARAVQAVYLIRQSTPPAGGIPTNQGNQRGEG